MSGRDIVGIAQTGTGKTLAYLLPLLRMWRFTKSPYPQILIIVPTRELVLQVVEQVEMLTRYMNVVVGGAYGGANIKRNIAMLEQGLDVIVSTPGRLLDLLKKGALKAITIKKVVIDEVDEMLNLGFRHQLMEILERLPEKKQSLLFSATMVADVEKMLNVFFVNPLKIEAAPVGTPLENIDQWRYDVPNFYTKVRLLKYLLEGEDFTKVLVFTSTKRLADQLAENLGGEANEEFGVIHSNKSQNYRFRVIDQFKSGLIRYVIATDIVARGIDVSQVSHVINFDLPATPENYIHRIGRTGRADKKGHSLSFVLPGDADYLAGIQKLMKYQIPLLPFPEDVEPTDELTPDEMPKIHVKNVFVKRPKKLETGPAFHPKKAKNMKVNLTRAERLKKRLKKKSKRKKRKK